MTVGELKKALRRVPNDATISISTVAVAPGCFKPAEKVTKYLKPEDKKVWKFLPPFIVIS